MFINRKLLNLAKGKEATIFEMTFWYVCSALADAARLAAWALFFICIAYRRIGILSMALLLSVVIFTLLRRGIEHIFSQRDAIRGDRFKQTVRKDLFGKLFYLGPQFTDVKRCGELVDTIRQQVEWLKFYYVNYMPLSISIFIVGVLFSVYGFLLSPVIGLVILLAVFGVLISPVAFYGIVQKKGQQEMVENARFYSDCMDGLRGITTLKAFNINQSQRERIDKQAELLRKATMKNLIVTTANTQTTELCVSMGLYLPVVIGALLLPGGSVAWEQLLVLFVMGHAVADHSRRILGMWLRAGKGISGLDAIYEIIDAEYPYSLNASEKEQRKIECGDIRFDNITFSYVQEGTPVVKDINLILRQGTQTALVGASGSGKSTLARLLFGFYKPQSGRICIGNQELDASTVHSMQDRVTAIWQDSHIFSASCFDNIHLAKPGSTADEVYEAAKRANIHELISSLPKGYDTLIGSGGIELSGGEKQRIIIARAFLRDAPILILDEATSSLDRKNEAEIQECIQELSDGRTVLIIAHRLDTIRHADQICVMENGSIIECGTHDELMNHGSRYSSLMSASEEMEVI